MRKQLFNEQSKLNLAHEIQQTFRYQYRDQWCSQAFINSHSRLWIQVFNLLVKEGFIEKKKSQDGNKYRWIAMHPL
jgi:hypothetical protein